MILLVDLCYRENSLGFEEFVLPVRRIVRRCGFPTNEIHYTRIQREGIGSAQGIVLCGTPLADNGFLENTGDFFGWVTGCPTPILGICAGMEVLTLLHGGTIQNCCEIGMTAIREREIDPFMEGMHGFEAYELHGYGCSPPPDFRILAESDNCIQIIRHSTFPSFGVMFHPEVRNEWVVERFLSTMSE
jgi:GMP synthase-like glutamine amidotransferase